LKKKKFDFELEILDMRYFRVMNWDIFGGFVRFGLDWYGIFLKDLENWIDEAFLMGML
jgi:hypothetical protein